MSTASIYAVPVTVALLSTLPSISLAGQACAPHELVVSKLAEHYQERSRYTAKADNGNIVTVFATDDNSTWTLTVHGPDGPTCLIASGRDEASLNVALSEAK